VLAESAEAAGTELESETCSLMRTNNTANPTHLQMILRQTIITTRPNLNMHTLCYEVHDVSKEYKTSKYNVTVTS